MGWLPGIGFLTIDEVVWITERITNVNPWPLIVDADDGFGDSPVVVYRHMHRLVKAGAMGITIDDSTGIRGFERMLYAMTQGRQPHEGMKLVPRNVWLAKVKATLAACEGTDCVTIARIGLPLKTREGFIEAMERALRAKDLGAFRGQCAVDGGVGAGHIGGAGRAPPVLAGHDGVADGLRAASPN